MNHKEALKEYDVEMLTKMADTLHDSVYWESDLYELVIAELAMAMCREVK